MRCALNLKISRRGVATTQGDVPSVAEGPFRFGDGEIERGYQQVATTLVGYRLEDRVEGHQRVTRKVHLRHEPVFERRRKHREMDVGRAPGVLVVAPWVSTGFDCDEPVCPFPVGQATARAGEVRVEGCGVI